MLLKREGLPLCVLRKLIGALRNEGKLNAGHYRFLAIPYFLSMQLGVSSSEQHLWKLADGLFTLCLTILCYLVVCVLDKFYCCLCDISFCYAF